MCCGIFRGDRFPERYSGFILPPSSPFLDSQAVHLSPRSETAFSSKTKKTRTCSGKLSFPLPMCKALLVSQNSHQKPALYLTFYFSQVFISVKSVYFSQVGQRVLLPMCRKAGLQIETWGELGNISGPGYSAHDPVVL